MSAILAELPLRAGDKIRILETDDRLIKSGTLAKNPTGSDLPYADSAEMPRGKTFYFSDGAFFMPNKEYKIEVEGWSKGFLIRPLFHILLEDIRRLSSLQGQTREVFEQGIVNEFVSQGYSEERARQVIEELMKR